MTSPVYSLCVQLPEAAADWLDDWLLARGFAAIEERDAESGRLQRVVYDESDTKLRLVVAALQVEVGPRGGLHWSIEAVESRWELGWTEHLRVEQLTPRLRVRPAYLPPEPGAADGSERELVLEPALAFGFGEHPTTRLAARFVESFGLAAPGGALLDVGCGTGVLCLVALRSGFRSAVGVDLSRQAVDVAVRNAGRNALADQARFVLGELDEVPGQFDLVVANIEAPALISLAAGTCARVAPGGAVALAGLLREQRQRVAEAYAACGVELELAEQDGDWILLTARTGGAPRPSSVAGHGAER